MLAKLVISLPAMTGIKLENSNEASLFQCELITNEKVIIHRGTKKKWSEFKKEYPDWDWDFGNSISLEELFRLRSKQLYIWSRIGQRLCQKYNMKFVMENTPECA
ncbi:unnamed protein product [Didymodactylos carnosus]|uniref:Uncharacterized protein n=1 Tax=Didymodactylos carnosus TaxID=1234261 RepID=A0A816A2B4_9BILA|nr:unnamed protein product [Didymodactylos carnosus]CAF4461805.1 unnamed protein product [Didymodactylos carnosus]